MNFFSLSLSLSPSWKKKKNQKNKTKQRASLLLGGCSYFCELELFFSVSYSFFAFIFNLFLFFFCGKVFHPLFVFQKANLYLFDELFRCPWKSSFNTHLWTVTFLLFAFTLFTQNLFLFLAKSWSFSDQFQLDLARGFCLGNVLKLNFVEICDNFAIVSSFFFVWFEIY